MRVLFMVSAVVLGALACARQVADPYSTGITLLSANGCPVFVGGVVGGSPAERAGIHTGDRVLTVDGTPVRDANQAARLFQSNSPTTVSLMLLRGDKEIKLVSERGKTILDL